MPKQAGRQGYGAPWDVLAQAAAVAAVLLPVVGIVVRWVAFKLGGIVPPGLAVADSPLDLAYTGGVVTVPNLFLIVVFYPIMRELMPRWARLERARGEVRKVIAAFEGVKGEAADIRGRYTARLDDLRERAVSGGPGEPEEVAAEVTSLEASFYKEAGEFGERVDGVARDVERTQRAVARALARMPRWAMPHPRVQLAAIAVEGVVIGVFLVALLSFPGDWVFVAGLAMGMAWIGALAYGAERLTFAAVLPPLALVLATSAVGAGISDTGGDAAFVMFQAGGPASGSYVEVARTDSVVYFVGCTPGHEVIGVRSDLILSERLLGPVSRPGTSILGMVVGRAAPALGYQLGCPGG